MSTRCREINHLFSGATARAGRIHTNCHARRLRAPPPCVGVSPNKPMHPTADTRDLIYDNPAGRRVIGGVRLLTVATIDSDLLTVLRFLYDRF